MKISNIYKGFSEHFKSIRLLFFERKNKINVLSKSCILNVFFFFVYVSFSQLFRFQKAV